MSKVKIDNDVFAYPMPMTLVGAMIDARPNFLAVAWLTRVNYKPPMVAVALDKARFTNTGIRSTRAFSVNVPGADLVAKTDYCGLVLGRTKDKSGLFTVFKGETGAPMIDECRMCLDCRLIQTVDLPANELFIGEIVGAYADDTCLTDGKPDVTKIDPFSLTMPDNGYWTLGTLIGKAWSIGKTLPT